MRRSDRQLKPEETLSILQNGEYGILSICSPDNKGYGIPLSYVYENNTLYFHCAHEGSKIDYLKNNQHVSFCVVGKTSLMPQKFSTLYESAIVAGTATLNIDDDEKRKALMLIIEKYSPDYIEEGKTYIDKAFAMVQVVKITIDSITGKARKQ
jgi:nitroimidazol reductase NimA-like FMN-containing flavoprotein (pyridoxamine 5'-phosphate oxidase superfamily)